MAIVFLAGKGRCDHSLSRSRVYSEGLGAIGGAVGTPDYSLPCAALLIRHDDDAYERHAVAVAVIRQPARSVVAGYLQRSLAERFNEQVVANSWHGDAVLMCQALLIGETFHYKKGPMHFARLLIDLAWPLRAATDVPLSARALLP